MNQSCFPVVGIIPSFNPDEKLTETVCGMFSAGFTHIIVVDDGSRSVCTSVFDRLAQMPGCTVLRHPVNRGKGRALKTAFSHYLEHYDLTRFRGVVTADADGQHLPEDILSTARAIPEDPSRNYFLSLGTRDFNEDSVPFKSRSGNKITTLVFQLLYGRRICDTQTGLRGISNAFLARCTELRGERFEYEINMLIAAARENCTMVEIPIQTVYFDSNRETHFRPVHDSLKIYRVMFGSFFRFGCSGLLSVAVDQGLFALFLYCVFQGLPDQAAIPLATILARLGSSFVNYSMNRSMVFSAGKLSRSTFVRYYLLCLMLMAASAAAVTALHILTLGNSSLLKFLVDGLLFLISYRVQLNWVFQKSS